MPDTISIAQLAALLGVPANPLGAQFKQTSLRRLGRSTGRKRERNLSLQDYAVARLAHEFQHRGRALDEALPIAADLIPELWRHIEGKAEQDTYALMVEGAGPRPQRHFLICDGFEKMAAQVAEALVRGWPRLQVTNLHAIAEELLVGWAFATGNAEKLAATYRERLDTMSPAQIERAEELLALFHDRMQGRREAPTATVSILHPPAATTTDNGTLILDAIPEPAPRQRVAS